MEKEYGYQLPKEMHKELGKAVNRLADETGEEITPEGVFQCFNSEYIELSEPLQLIEFRSERLDDHTVEVWAVVIYEGSKKNLRGVGNGPIAAFFNGLEEIDVSNFELLSYSEHSLGRGADSKAVSYIQLKDNASGAQCYGAGIDTNIALASIRGVVSAVNRLMGNRF
jgi:2-isopropylmalate synthase